MRCGSRPHEGRGAAGPAGPGPAPAPAAPRPGGQVFQGSPAVAPWLGCRGAEPGAWDARGAGGSGAEAGGMRNPEEEVRTWLRLSPGGPSGGRRSRPGGAERAQRRRGRFWKRRERRVFRWKRPACLAAAGALVPAGSPGRDLLPARGRQLGAGVLLSEPQPRARPGFLHRVGSCPAAESPPRAMGGEVSGATLPVPSGRPDQVGERGRPRSGSGKGRPGRARSRRAGRRAGL